MRSQQIFRFSRNFPHFTEFQCSHSAHNSLPIVLVLNQINPVSALSCYLLQHFSLISAWVFQIVLTSGFQSKSRVRIVFSLLQATCHVPHAPTSHFPRSTTQTLCEIQFIDSLNTKLIITYFKTADCCQQEDIYTANLKHNLNRVKKINVQWFVTRYHRNK